MLFHAAVCALSCLYWYNRLNSDVLILYWSKHIIFDENVKHFCTWILLFVKGYDCIKLDFQYSAY